MLLSWLAARECRPDKRCTQVSWTNGLSQFSVLSRCNSYFSSYCHADNLAPGALQLRPGHVCPADSVAAWKKSASLGGSSPRLGASLFPWRSDESVSSSTCVSSSLACSSPITRPSRPIPRHTANDRCEFLTSPHQHWPQPSHKQSMALLTWGECIAEAWTPRKQGAECSSLTTSVAVLMLERQVYQPAPKAARRTVFKLLPHFETIGAYQQSNLNNQGVRQMRTYLPGLR